MKWNKFRLKTTTEGEDIVSSILAELGVEGVEIEDNVPLTAAEKEQMFVDIPLQTKPDDHVAYVSFYLEADEDEEAGQKGAEADGEAGPGEEVQISAAAQTDAGAGAAGSAESSAQTGAEAGPAGSAESSAQTDAGASAAAAGMTKTDALLAQIRAELAEMAQFVDLGPCTIEESQTEDVDWINNWKKYFHQFSVDNVLIVPSWEEPEPAADDAAKMIIHIDPGTAFGTGMHETTQLCIRQLRKYVQPGMCVLDVGCGSGILGMVALKFGADYSVGTDLDPCAIEATHENMAKNGIGKEQYEVMIGNVISEKNVQDAVGYEKYDIAAANILAEVLVDLTPEVKAHLKKGAVYITSGILEEKEEMVTKAAKEAGFTVLEVNHQGEWISVTAQFTGTE